MMTFFFTAARDKCHNRAIFHTIIYIIISGALTVARTFYKGCHAASFFYLFSHDSCNGFCHFVSAYRTAIYRCFSGCDCSCQSVASRISTATAVIARKLFSDGDLFFINFHCKFLSGYPKEQSDHQSCAAYQSRSNKYSCNHKTPSLNHSGKSEERNGHQTCGQKYDRHSPERFRYIVIFDFLTKSCHQHDGDGKSDCGSKTIDRAFQDSVIILYI